MSTLRMWFTALAVAFLASFVGVAAAQNSPPDTASTIANPMIPRVADIPGVGDPSLVENLKQGGYIIFFRHCATDWQQQDTMGQDFANRAAQRNLSEAGEAEAASIGKAFRSLAIPIDSVFASPMWRCRDTAQIAFGRYEQTIDLYGKGPVFRDNRVMPPDEPATYRERRLKMLGTAPNQGMNRVLIGHQDPMIPIIPGLHRDELREGDALVIQPQADGTFKVVSMVTSADWIRLAAAYGKPPAATAKKHVAVKKAPASTKPAK